MVGATLPVSVLIYRTGATLLAYAPYSRVHGVGIYDFFVKKLEVIKRFASFASTQNVLTINVA